MWDQRYAEEGFAYGERPNDFLIATAGYVTPGGRVLMLGDGEGRNGVYMAEQGHEVHSVDLSPVGMAKAAKLAASRGVTITTEVADLATFDLGDAAWDGIVSIFCHMPPSIRQRVHHAIGKALVPGGVLLLEAYAKEQFGRGTGGPPDEAMLMSLTELENEFDGLEILHGESFDRKVIEGKYHTGRAAVTQIIARRPA